MQVVSSSQEGKDSLRNGGWVGPLARNGAGGGSWLQRGYDGEALRGQGREALAERTTRSRAESS